MVIVFRPYVSRWTRAWNVLKAKPQYWMTNYTEIFFSSIIVIPCFVVNLSYKLYKEGMPNDWVTLGYNKSPYYRHYYEVRRPDDRLSLQWRVPEDYPPEGVLLFRPGISPSTTWKDHAWDVK